MHDEHEHDSIRLTYALELQNGLHRKMPRPGTIRRGYQDGKRADHESYQGGHSPQPRSIGKTIKSQIEMQEIGKPYPQGIHYIYRYMADIAQRKHSVHNIAKQIAGMVEPRQPPGQNGKKHQHDQQTSCRDPITGCRKASGQFFKTYSRLGKEHHEHLDLQQDCQSSQ